MKSDAMIRNSSGCVSGFTPVLALVSTTTASAQIVPTFSDSFDRVDGAVGNDWQITASGNGDGGGGNAPTAAISNEALVVMAEPRLLVQFYR